MAGRGDAVNAPSKWRRQWLARTEAGIAAFQSDTRLDRLERAGAVAVAGTAILFALGALKAITKGAGIISAALSDRISDVLVPLTGGLAVIVIALLMVLFAGAASTGRRR